MPKWKELLDYLMTVRVGVYENNYNNDTEFGREFGENGVAWCVIFDWCMYNRVGLASIVPKVDNVTVFSTWAKNHGQWSAYPSVGAWVNFDNGEHTETVVGFDADNVYTKGGNTHPTGDTGGSNGVFEHANARRAARITGYFAPRFPDGKCPPTADPADPRGGAALTKWRVGDALPYGQGGVTPPPVDPPVTPPVVIPPAGTQKTYTVKAGDTLGTVAMATLTSVDDIVSWNGWLKPGAVIKVGPTVAAPPPTDPPVTPPAVYVPPAFPAGLTPNQSTPSAKELQKALKAAGYLAASVALSDNYGPSTMAAVVKFHAANPSYASGPNDPAIGPKGWAALFRKAYG